MFVDYERSLRAYQAVDFDDLIRLPVQLLESDTDAVMGWRERIGYLLVDGQQIGKPDQILAAIIIFALLGKLADAILVAVTRPFLRWQDLGAQRL